MAQGNTSKKCRLKSIEKISNYFIKKIDQNELISTKIKKVCTTLNYIEHFLVLASSVTGCSSISSFASLLVIPIGITSFAKGLKILQ